MPILSALLPHRWEDHPRHRLESSISLSCGNRQSQCRIVSKLVGIILILVALSKEKKRGKQKFAKRMGDEILSPRVRQALDEPVNDPDPLCVLPQQDSSPIEDMRSSRASIRREPLN
jgi:hypothetical protein